jgi:hypothetical protein
VEQEWLFFVWFGFYNKKKIKLNFLNKKNQNWFKPTSFGSVFWKKTSSNQFGSDLTRFGSVFPVWLGFFRGFFNSVRFFRFQAYKNETEPVGFFKILIGFFSQFVFFGYFFSDFLNLINFQFFYSPLFSRHLKFFNI